MIIILMAAGALSFLGMAAWGLASLINIWAPTWVGWTVSLVLAGITAAVVVAIYVSLANFRM